MLNFWKKFRYFALGGVLLASCGCSIPSFGWVQGLLCPLGQCLWCGVLTEFLIDNDGVFDLFAD